MSLSTHIGADKALPKLKMKTTVAKSAALKKRAEARLARTAQRQAVQRKSTRLGDLSGRALTSANLTAMCQVAIIRSGKSFASIAEEQGLAPATVSRLLYGKTKRVSGLTLLAALEAGGVSLEMSEAH